MFSGKVAIITGSAQGLGKAFSRVLLEQGGKVREREKEIERERGEGGFYLTYTLKLKYTFYVFMHFPLHYITPQQKEQYLTTVF